MSKSVKATKTSKEVTSVLGGLTPTICETFEEVGEVSYMMGRRRPVVAINDEGEMVVCCRRTALRKGWTIEGQMFTRAGGRGAVAVVPAAPAKKVAAKKGALQRAVEADLAKLLA